MTISEVVSEQIDFSARHRSRHGSWDTLPYRERLLSLFGEVAEVSDILKKVERGDTELPEVKEALGEELADCLIYIALLSSCFGIDLEEAYQRKMEKNWVRFKEWEIKEPVPTFCLGDPNLTPKKQG